MKSIGVVARLALVVGIAFLVCRPASAQLGWAFGQTGSGGCPQCTVQLQVETTSGTNTVTSFTHGVSVIIGGEQVGLQFGPQYFAGFCCSTGDRKEYRNYFAFDLAGIGPIISANLLIPLPSFDPSGMRPVFAPAGSVTYTLHGVPFREEVQYLDGGDPQGYAVLGSGPIYGSVSITPAAEGSTIAIAINPAGVDYLNAARQYSGVPTPGEHIQIALLGGAVTLPALPVPVLPLWMGFVLSFSLLALGMLILWRRGARRTL